MAAELAQELETLRAKTAIADTLRLRLRDKALMRVTLTDAEVEFKIAYDALSTHPAATQGRCHANSDGDCDWQDCPQAVEYLLRCKLAAPLSEDARHF